MRKDVYSFNMRKAEMVISCCREIAKTKGVELEDIYWATDIIEINHILTIIAKSGVIEIRATSVSQSKVNRRLKRAISDIQKLAM